MREPGAQVADAEPGQRSQVGRSALVLRQEAQEVAEVAPIGGDGVGGQPPLLGEVVEPGLDRPCQIGSGCQSHGHGRIDWPVFCQSARKASSPLSVSGWLASWRSTVGGTVATSAPILAASTT